MTHQGDAFQEEIGAHIESHLGAIRHVYCFENEGSAELCIGHVPPTDHRPVHTLITSGVSLRAMNVTKPDAPAHLELMMTLPREWQFGPEVSKEERWSWPVHLLKSLARRAHEEDGWLGWGHLIPNGRGGHPYAETTKQCAALIVPSLLVPTEFYELETPEKTIAFYAVVPIYQEEYDLGRHSGTDALFSRLIDGDVTDVVEPSRRNVARKRFWLFG